MDTIFIDTNSIKNENVNSFFGNASKIKEVSRLVDIAIPSIVIDEIIRQKTRFLKSQLSKLKSNHFANIIGFEEKYLPDCITYIDAKIKELFDNSSNEFPYKLVTLEHSGKLEKIKELAIKNIAPFESESDKGFKDSYIHLTICEFLKVTEDDVFLLTNDKRLKESFKDKNVTVISDIQEYYSYRQEYFTSDYFIGILNEFFDTTEIEPKHILSAELTEDDDWKIRIDYGGEEVELLADFYSREIIENE